MTTYQSEGPKFSWGKVLGFLILIALIIIVIIARSNAVEEGERRNRAMTRAIITNETATRSAIQTEVATRVVPVMVIDGRVSDPPSRAATPTPTVSPDDCTHFEGLDSSVEDAIARGYEINLAIIEESASPEEFARKRLDGLLEIAQTWRDIAANASAVPARLLGLIANLWEQGTAIAVDDAAAQVRNLRSIADAYSNLADRFDECESTRDFADDLREEVDGIRWLADEAS